MSRVEITGTVRGARWALAACVVWMGCATVRSDNLSDTDAAVDSAVDAPASDAPDAATDVPIDATTDLVDARPASDTPDVTIADVVDADVVDADVVDADVVDADVVDAADARDVVDAPDVVDVVDARDVVDVVDAPDAFTTPDVTTDRPDAADVRDASPACSFVGLWRAPTFYTRYDADGRFMTSTSATSTPSLTGRYVVTGSSITFSDASSMRCASKRVTYSFTFSADCQMLALRLTEDSCGTGPIGTPLDYTRAD